MWNTAELASGYDVLVTLSGYSPGEAAAQWFLLAVTMFCQNSMSRDVIGVPSDHFHPLSFIVTLWPPWEWTGSLARLRSELSFTVPLLPNQYSGRYIRNWNWLRFATLK